MSGTPSISREEESIARHLPLRAGGSFERWVEVADEAELLALIIQNRADKLPLRPVPPFCDAMPPEGGLSGVALRLGRGFERVELRPEGVWVGASAPLCLAALHPGYTSFDRAPGTLTDALEEGWIQPAVSRIRRLRGRRFEEVDFSLDGRPIDPRAGDPKAPDPKAGDAKGADSKTGELKGVVVAAWLRPGVTVSPPRAGAAFAELKKKGPSLRDVLRRARLGGLRVHGAGLAEDDPAVLVNRGDASARQLRLLVTVIKERVYSMTGIQLEERLIAPGRGGRG